MKHPLLYLVALLAGGLLPVAAGASRRDGPRMPPQSPTHAAAMARAAACAGLDSAVRDTARADTLREVVVRADSVFPVVRALEKNIGRGGGPTPMSLGDVLEKLSPGLNDKITHPFAIRQRKAERRKKKLRKALEQYDRAKTFNELLDEAVKRQQLEDERARRAESQGD